MRRLFPIFLSTFLALASSAQTPQERADLNMTMQKIGTTLMAIKALYIDTTNTVSLGDNAIKAMLEQLDPHSNYSNAEETKKLTEPLDGNFEGIGVQFNVLNDTLVVVQPVSKGPSEKAGILAGDRIITVDDSVIAGVKMPREKMMKLLRGPKNSVVMLGIKRRGVEELIPFRIIRDKIPLYSVDAAYMIRPEIGIIRLGNFAASTHDEIHDAIKKLKKKGMKSLILDLEQNGGGYLEAANEVASEFLTKGELVVYTDGRSVPQKQFRASGNGIFTEGKVIVLVDQYTASAAEIVSGAIQDQDRGYIVGRRTFGKGLVQRPVELPDGSMVRLTVSHYFTPTGRCIQKPYEKGKKKDYEEDILNRLNSGELMHIDSIHLADSLKYYTLKEHRVVYGGGGIMPDYFVPLDTTVYTRFHRMLTRKNILLNNYLEYFDKNRKELTAKHKDFERFKDEFEPPQQLIDSIVAEGKRSYDKPVEQEELQKTMPRLRLQLKALFARDIWDMNEYFAIINEDNESVKKALELLGTE